MTYEEFDQLLDKLQIARALVAESYTAYKAARTSAQAKMCVELESFPFADRYAAECAMYASEERDYQQAANEAGIAQKRVDFALAEMQAMARTRLAQ